MPIPAELKDVRDLFTATEYGLLEASYEEAPAAELKKKLTLARTLRDKWKDQYTRQRRARQQSRGGRAGAENDRSHAKLELFTEAVRRFEALLAAAPTAAPAAASGTQEGDQGGPYPGPSPGAGDQPQDSAPDDDPRNGGQEGGGTGTGTGRTRCRSRGGPGGRRQEDRCPSAPQGNQGSESQGESQGSQARRRHPLGRPPRSFRSRPQECGRLGQGEENRSETDRVDNPHPGPCLGGWQAGPGEEGHPWPSLGILPDSSSPRWRGSDRRSDRPEWSDRALAKTPQVGTPACGVFVWRRWEWRFSSTIRAVAPPNRPFADACVRTGRTA